MKIKENVLYVSEDHSLFTIQFGHIRRFLSVDDVSVAGFNIDERVTIALEAIKEIPRGPFMPKKYSEALEVALREEKSTDILRQIWVSGFKGSGHEVGAGRRPTSVPSKCKVTYVDAFTFDEASDGSFINQANEGFVSVSIYESAETLNGIENGSSNFFIMCHVIEHLHNPILALRTIYSKLKVGGSLFMVVPWGKFTFDRQRQNTSLHHIVADYLSPSKNRDLEHYLEFLDLAAHNKNWINEGLESHKRGRDTHLHVFSPESLKLLLDFCCTLDPWTSVKIESPTHNETLQEFYVLMVK